MRFRNHSTARAAAGAGALIVAGVFVGSTVLADAAAEPAPPAASDEAQQFTTQNGTMRIALPAGWSVDDESRAEPGDDGQLRWQNLVTFTAPDGTALFYYDGTGSDTGIPLHDWGVTERAEGRQGLEAVGWWQQTDHGISADVMLTDPAAGDPDAPPAGVVTHEGIERNHVLRMSADAGGTPIPQFASTAEAEQWLAGRAPQQALAVISSAELLPVPGDALP
ncbi:hypothetical protein [Agrococcus baldri]|uniref:Uncharacterized protein n=1 Tax=Agrococcus baldri TaxID=153730 RepID=A0AA87RE13_9MICO|nr:hypothetical protein [Agrococcus baldri]GEK81335.1 hypothetical protein ABA31_26860 [Agrococcus baldri]